MSRTVITALAIVIAAFAVSLSILHAESVSHRDAQETQKLMRDQRALLYDLRNVTCDVATCTTTYSYEGKP